jgi:hypothetical protein
MMALAGGVLTDTPRWALKAPSVHICGPKCDRCARRVLRGSTREEHMVSDAPARSMRGQPMTLGDKSPSATCSTRWRTRGFGNMAPSLPFEKNPAVYLAVVDSIFVSQLKQLDPCFSGRASDFRLTCHVP